MKKKKVRQSLVDFLFEIGTLRKTQRSHMQTLLTGDLSDNILSHTAMVTNIGIFLAEIAGANIGVVACMCTSHDWGETRSGDQNWIHKLYVTADEEHITYDQAALHQSPFMKKIIKEYQKRKTLESLIAKDADTIGQLVLLKEYVHQGNEEAKLWLAGKTTPRPYAWIDRLKTEHAKQMGRLIYDTCPSDWWKTLQTGNK
jgi:5'-deoxynucleotidase YfbR-like HD superfamily hydrolase